MTREERGARHFRQFDQGWSMFGGAAGAAVCVWGAAAPEWKVWCGGAAFWMYRFDMMGCIDWSLV